MTVRTADAAAPRPTFPRWLLGTVGGLMVLSLGLAAANRIDRNTPSLIGESPTVASRDLRFEDRPDGSIAIIDATASTTIDTVAPGSNGFLRGALRGLVRERKRSSLGPEAAFRLIGRADGHLLLRDLATGRTLDLGAFGPTNADVFARLLVSPGAPEQLAVSNAPRSNPTP